MSRNQIDIHVNRDPSKSLEVTDTACSVHESFDLVLHGHGQPAHVHCRIEGELADVATVDETNHYVEGTETTVVPVTLTAPAEAVSGAIVITAGYGMLEETIDVEVEPDSSPVLVDDALGSPPAETEAAVLERIPTQPLATVLVVGLGILVAGAIGAQIDGFVGLLVFVALTLAVVASGGFVLRT